MFLGKWKRLPSNKKREYIQTNRGKGCSGDGCNSVARVKGLCINCYNLKRYHDNKAKKD